MGYLRLTGSFLWKSFVGVFFCQGLLISVLVVGWTYGAMQRAAVKRWLKERVPNATLHDAAREVPAFAHLNRWPNWFRSSYEEPKRLRRWFGGFGRNVSLGIAGLATTWSLTLLPMVFWNASWYAGWNNSFYKGYEQAGYGPSLGVLGVVLFMIAMLYVPMAQARHAISGEWRSFYDFRTVRAVARERPFACLLLTAAFSAFSLPIMIFKALPLFLEQVAPQTVEMNAVELLAYMNAYYFRLSILGFAVYVFLRVAAARVYAGGLIRAYRAGRIGGAELSPFEQKAFRAMRIPGGEQASAVWTRPVRRAFAGAVAAAGLFIWFTFVAQIYVSQFLNYHSMQGWLNQPLVQAPWFSYVPGALREAASELNRR